MNVSTLMVLLVCIIADYAHAASFLRGWESVQTRTKRAAAKYELSVVEDWDSVCEEVCGSGYGGPGCGDRCSISHYGSNSLTALVVFREMCPIFCTINLGESKCACASKITEPDARNRDLLCSATCRLRGFRLSGCTKCAAETDETTSETERTDDGSETTDEQTTESEEGETTDDSTATNEDTTSYEETTDDTTSTTTTTTTSSTTTSTTQATTTTTKSTTQATTTTPDWSQLCETLCRNGEGGSLCSCDIPPFF